MTQCIKQLISTSLSEPIGQVDDPRISLNITTNKSEGREGELVGYRCTAVNIRLTELSEVRIFCAGKMASTTFLTPGKELHLDGSLEIKETLKFRPVHRARMHKTEWLRTIHQSSSG